MNLRFLEGDWRFGKFKLQQIHPDGYWEDVPWGFGKLKLQQIHPDGYWEDVPMVALSEGEKNKPPIKYKNSANEEKKLDAETQQGIRLSKERAGCLFNDRIGLDLSPHDLRQLIYFVEAEVKKEDNYDFQGLLRKMKDYLKSRYDKWEIERRVF